MTNLWRRFVAASTEFSEFIEAEAFMSKRKAILLLLTVFAILAYSQLNRSAIDSTGLPAAKEIHGDMLVSIPPVEDAIHKTGLSRIPKMP
jgi:hypothetical protein